MTDLDRKFLIFNLSTCQGAYQIIKPYNIPSFYSYKYFSYLPIIFIIEKTLNTIPIINKTILKIGNFINNFGITNNPNKLKIICIVMFPNIESVYIYTKANTIPKMNV